jgi:glycosyltransferase involved in cell wall biosynthesis
MQLLIYMEILMSRHPLPPLEHTYPLRPFILIDTKIVGGPGKGLFQFLTNAHRLMPQGFEPTVAHFRYGDEVTEFERAAASRNVPLLDLPARSPLDREALALAAATIRARGCNFIQSHGYKSHLYAAFLKNMLGLPWIAFAHGWTSENAKVRLYHSIDRLLLPRADVVVAVSPKLQATVRSWRHGNEPTVLIENAVEPPPYDDGTIRHATRQHLGISSQTLLLGSFGRLSREKGHRYLLHAFSSLTQSYSDIHLLIRGDGPELQPLRETIQATPRPSRITLLPHTSDITPFFRAIDIFALPSLTEGLPNVLLEALSFGCPVVSTAVGAVPTFIRDTENGLLVPPGDEYALERALRQLAADSAAREALGRAGRASLYPRFCPVARARAILETYRALIEPHATATRLSQNSECWSAYV